MDSAEKKENHTAYKNEKKNEIRIPASNQGNANENINRTQLHTQQLDKN